MRSRGGLTLLAFLAAMLAPSAWSGGAAAAEACPIPPCFRGEGDKFYGGGTQARDGSSESGVQPVGNRPRTPRAPLSPTYIDRNVVPTCTGNSAFDGGTLCNAALETCPSEDDVRYWVFETTIERATGKPVAGTQPRLVDTVCLGPEDPGPDPAVLLPAAVQSEFQRVVVRGGSADVSPRPDTLVNIATRFQTDAPPSYDIPLTLLNQSVVITATAQSYTWHLDDGDTRVSTRPRGYLEHVYRKAGTYEVFVSITWSGTFSVNGGPARPITGTVEVDGEPTRIRVQQARSELVRD